MRFDHKKFFDGFKREFGDFSAEQQLTVDGIEFFLDKFDVETRLKNIPQYAYVFATAYHESGKPRKINGKRVMIRMQPVKEGRESLSSPRRANQDRYWLAGWYGRGFPQTTWEENYLKSGKALGLGDLFVRKPDLLLTPEYAYEAMVICMVKGLYRRDKLTKKPNTLDKFFPNDSKFNEARYIAGRDIINGDIAKNGKLIAGYAIKIERCLRESLLPETRIIEPSGSTLQGDKPLVAVSEEPAEIGEIPPEIIHVDRSVPQYNTDDVIQTEPEPAPQVGNSFAPEPDPEPKTEAEAVIPVVQATAEDTPKPSTEEKIDKATNWLTWLNGKFMALPPALGAMFLGIWNWIQGASVYLTLGFFGAGAFIAIGYISWYMYLKNKREQRESNERIEAERTKQLRDQMAHEITLKQMESAMRKDFNTVAVVPKPLENSDSPEKNKPAQSAPQIAFKPTYFLGLNG